MFGPTARHHRSVRRRVLTLSAAVLVVTLAVWVVGVVGALRLMVERSTQNSVYLQATRVAALIEERGAAVDTVQNTPVQEALVQLIDADGRVVAWSDDDARERLTDFHPAQGEVWAGQVDGTPADEDEPAWVYTVGVRDGSGRYTLVVVEPIDTETVSDTAGLLAFSALGLVVVVLVLIAVVVTRALRPVEEIRRDVARIQHSRGGERVTVPPTGDEIARLAQTMNLMLERLDGSDRAVRRFVSDASHELRSPLATVRAGLETATAQHPPDVPLLLAETTRMQRLVEDLLTLARADDQGLTLARDEVDLDDLVDGEVRRLRAVSPHQVTATIGAARVLGDELRLTQVVRNLADNAARHAVGAVRVTVDVDHGEAVLRVDNDGPPVAAERREQIFERFARLQTARDRDSGGSGLGLAIVRTIAEAHGGRALTTQAPDGWCRFEVRLPVAD